MNRIQSGDLKTLLSLQASNSDDEGYKTTVVSPHDIEEIQRMQSQTQGLGDTLYDDASGDFTDTLHELGLSIGSDGPHEN